MTLPLQRLVLREFQKSNPERFNEDLIYMRRNERDSLHEYFNDVFASLKVNGIQYLSSQTITDESEFHKYVKKKTKVIEESRLDLIEAKFRLTWENETKDVTLYVFFPKLIDEFFFQLNGNRYFAVYQISDRNFYSTRVGLFLKTLLMPLGVHSRQKSFETMNGNTLEGREYLLDFFKTRSQSADAFKNLFHYMYVKFGVTAAIDYFFNHDCGEDESPRVFLQEADAYEEYDGYDAIQLRKDLFLYFITARSANQNYVNMVVSVVASLHGIRKVSSLTDDSFWKKKIINTTTNLAKADKAIMSLERVLDERTKRNLREITDPESKKDSFGVIRWMCLNYESLINIDTVDVYNRRLRLYEYMLYPLLIKFSDTSYRIFNSRNVDIRRLETMFSNIGPMFIVKHLVTNELFRYNNATSTLDLFSVALRFSAKGPQALGGGGGVILKYRAVHPSYVGNIGLNAASASDPGMSGTLAPMSKNIGNMFFNPPESVPSVRYFSSVADVLNDRKAFN